MKFLISFYEKIISFGESLGNIVLLIMRLYCGYGFYQSGVRKVSDIPKVEAGFAALNIPFPLINAYLVGWLELVCGLCLVFGLASRLISIPLAIIMLVALLTAHFDTIQSILENPDGFIHQSAFLFFLTALIVISFGPGKISIDYLLEKYFFKKSKNGLR